MLSLSRATRAALARAGVDGLYGDEVDGWPVVPTPPGPLRELLAAAHRRVHGRAAGVVDGADVTVDGVAVGIDGARGSSPADRRVEADHDIVERIAAARAPVVLVGPGVVRDGAVAGLHALAAAGSLGVLNTWGAKGVFDWRSPHHLATAGLQARDFELGGLADADLIVATGIDDDEAPAAAWQLAPHVVVPTGALDPTAERLNRPRTQPAVPPLRTMLAAITQEGWAATGSPLSPTRATRAYRNVLGACGGLVAADAGLAGYWVARTFATTEIGSAVVPAVRTPGFAAACALVARLRQPLRPVLVVVDARDGAGDRGDAVDATTRAVLDLASALGVGIAVEAWGDGGERLDAGAHAARLAELVVAERPTVTTLATDPALLARMVDAAGPITAWGGL